MSVQASDSEHLFLYENTGDMPIPTPCFPTEEHAEDFLEYAEKASGGPIAYLSVKALEDLREQWAADRLDIDGDLIEAGAHG